MQEHKWFRLLFIFFLVKSTLLLTGCGKEDITIGFSGNLTGTSSEIAIDAMYGAQLAVSDFNAKDTVHGRHLNLIIEDDGGTADTAVSADERLKEQGACAIIGHIISGVAQESFTNTNADHFVMISPTMSSSTYYGADDYFYALVTESIYQSKYISKFLLHQGYKKIGYLYQLENENYSYAFVTNTNAPLKEEGIEPAFVEAFSSSDADSFSATVNEIKEADLDALVIAGSAYDVAYYAQVMEKNGCLVPVFTSTWAMSDELITIAGPAAEGIYTINTYDSSSATPAFLKFEESYQNTYGRSPTFASVYSYESVMYLADALKISKSFSGDNIKKALDSFSSIEGLQGQITINENGEAVRDMYLFQVQNQAFVRVDAE